MIDMYSGIIPPLVTPLSEDGNVCEESVKNLIAYVRPHVQAIIPALSSGEGWKLSEKQWLDMALFSKRYAKDLPVLIGILAKSTEEVITHAKKLEGHGIDAIVVSTPFQAGLSQEVIFEHFQAIRASTELPIFIYNEAAISGNEIEFHTFSKIFQLDQITGIKESSGVIEMTRQLIEAKYPVFQGWENLCYESQNAQGYILPLANLEPQICWEMFQEPTEKKQEEINCLCTQYNLFGSNWFSFLKNELYRREIIKTNYLV